MLSYLLFPPGRTPGEEFSHPCGEAVDVVAVRLLASLGLSLPLALSYLAVGQAFPFRLSHCLGFD